MVAALWIQNDFFGSGSNFSDYLDLDPDPCQILQEFLTFCRILTKIFQSTSFFCINMLFSK
jgi:hypothetical protein